MNEMRLGGELPVTPDLENAIQCTHDDRLDLRRRILSEHLFSLSRLRLFFDSLFRILVRE